MSSVPNKDHQEEHEELVSPEMVPSVAFHYETLTKNYNRCFVLHLPERDDCLKWPLKLWREDTFRTRVSAENETPKRRCSKLHMKYDAARSRVFMLINRNYD